MCKAMTGHVNIFCLYPQIFPPARKICGMIRPKQIEKEIERVSRCQVDVSTFHKILTKIFLNKCKTPVGRDFGRRFFIPHIHF